jgi:hypothetical protein
MIYNYPLDGGVLILDLYVTRDKDVKLSFNKGIKLRKVEGDRGSS